MDKDQQDKGTQDKVEALVVKVGDEEKKLTAADVQELLSKHSGLQKKVEGLANFEKILDRYGVDTDTYLKHSEGAIAIASKLIEEGVIDVQGKLVKKDQAPPKDKDGGLDRLIKSDDKGGGSREDDIVGKALGPLSERLKKIEETQSKIIESDMKSRLQRKFSTLDDEDTDVVLDAAFRDRTKTLNQHAEAYVQSKEKRMADLRKKHAAEFGVNLEEFDSRREAEKINKDKGGTDLSFLVGEKKLSFGAGNDKNKLTPRQATIEFFKKTLGR